MWSTIHNTDGPFQHRAHHLPLCIVTSGELQGGPCETEPERYQRCQHDVDEDAHRLFDLRISTRGLHISNI